MELFSEIKTLYLNEKMSDIILIVDGNKLPAHKLLLATKSNVFQAMFFGDMIESRAKEVEIKETTVEAFKLMLKYIYFEELDLGNQNNYKMTFEIYRIAHRFELKKLIEILHKSLVEMVNNDVNTFGEFVRCPSSQDFESWISEQKRILEENPSNRYMETIQNIAAIHEFANLFDLNDLRLACHQFIAGSRNGYNIIAGNSFLCDSSEAMKTILGTMNVSQTAIVYALRSIRLSMPELNIETFQSLIMFDKCTINDIKELRKINLFDDVLLFEVITSKSMEVMINNEKKNQEISKLKSDNKNLETNLKKSFKQKFEQLKGEIKKLIPEPNFGTQFFSALKSRSSLYESSDVSVDERKKLHRLLNNFEV